MMALYICYLFLEPVSRYVSKFEKMSASALGCCFIRWMESRFLKGTADVNVIERLTADCRSESRNFVRKTLPNETLN